MRSHGLEASFMAERRHELPELIEHQFCFLIGMRFSWIERALSEVESSLIVVAR